MINLIKELYDLQQEFEEHPTVIESFTFTLTFDSGYEIDFSYDISLGWDTIEEYRNLYNACDLRTNLEGVQDKISCIRRKYL